MTAAPRRNEWTNSCVAPNLAKAAAGRSARGRVLTASVILLVEHFERSGKLQASFRFPTGIGLPQAVADRQCFGQQISRLVPAGDRRSVAEIALGARGRIAPLDPCQSNERRLLGGRLRLAVGLCRLAQQCQMRAGRFLGHVQQAGLERYVGTQIPIRQPLRQRELRFGVAQFVEPAGGQAIVAVPRCLAGGLQSAVHRVGDGKRRKRKRPSDQRR